MKCLAYAIVVAIFVLVHSPQGDHVRSYEGQSRGTIKALLAGEGVTGEFITQEKYQSYMKAHKLPGPGVPSAANIQATKDLKDPAKTPNQRIDALIKVLDL